ncbi:rod shape determining protein RodA [Paenibacillus anaericanus]|uniref:FtsW/RodA/SpoVE family cell cycle protein n=1 Tax=Paenibacillus anaericanus TaxID=170367 RepID=UPI0027882A60|nr:FtsW/RodA/SpoVE family cell cycle protein [Paenibacillus anaericanus]MDQ0089819.1 rod shape determining protein RodA [Paenibacillus anaericanus]
MLTKFKKIDFAIVIILFFLMGISIAVLYSATKDTQYEGYHLRMIAYYVVGFIAFIVFSFLDFRIFVKYAPYIYVFGVGLLVVVMFVGNTYHNATGWLTLPGGLSFQPAEFFKLLLIIFLAFLLIRKRKSQLLFWRDVVPLGLFTFIPFAAVMAQNDMGNALSYIVILAGMLWIGNIKYTHAFIAVAVFAGAAIGGISAYKAYHDEVYTFFEEIGREHWIERIDPWLVPEKATAKAIYHTKNAKLAIASGGMTGEGYMQGETVQSQRVPLTYSDSIFVVIAEEFGFIGSSVLLLLYFVLIHRLILTSLECRDRSGPYIIVGIVAMLLYQIFENIGMFIGLMPLTGITLPFISYGGTSLLINMASIGIAMSIRIHGNEGEDVPQITSARLNANKA